MNKELIDFLKETEKLKTIKRQNMIKDGNRNETDAEHSWQIAFFVLLMEKRFPDIDITKALKMALIHDLPELYAGDTPAFGNNTSAEKQHSKEVMAAKKLFNQYSNNGQELLALWNEFETSETQESKLVKALDKLIPIISNIANEGIAWKQAGVTVEKLDAIKRQYMQFDPGIKQLYEDVLIEAKKVLSE